jgi:hypothetical protein
MGDEPHAPHWTAALVIAELRRAMRRPVIRAPPRYSLLPEPKEALPPPNVVVLRDNLDENGSGNRSVKRRPVAKPCSCWSGSFASFFGDAVLIVATYWL